MSYQTHSFLVGPLSGQRSIDEMLYGKSLKFVYSVMNSNNSIVAHIGQLIRQSAKSPIGGNVACFRYKFGIDVDDNVLKNLRLISRCFELNGERNITAYVTTVGLSTQRWFNGFNFLVRINHNKFGAVRWSNYKQYTCIRHCQSLSVIYHTKYNTEYKETN